MKEVRNGNLIATVKTNLPNVGYVKLNTERKATFFWRNIMFVVSSRLTVKERGFHKDAETTDSILLQNKLRGIAA